MVSTQLDSYFGIIEERVPPEGYAGTDVTTGAFANDTNLEILKFANGGNTATLAADFTDAGFKSVVGGTGADVISFSTATTVSIDAGSTAGSDSFTGSSSDDSLTFTSNLGTSGATASIDGGAGNDTIVLKASGVAYVEIDGGDGVDTINLGATHTGAVAIVIDAGDSTTTTATAVTDIITNYAAGSDSFVLGAAGDTANYAESETSVDSLTTLLAAADEKFDGTVLYYFGVTGGNGYLVIDDVDHLGANAIVQLTGITTFAATEISA